MDIVERLKEHATGYEEWRVANPEDGSYVISFSWSESCRPEHEAREWLADHLSRNPDSWVKGYEVRKVMVQGERDLMLLAATDEITRLRSDLALAQGQRNASNREIERLWDENAGLRADRDEWAAKWQAVRRELAAVKYPGGTGVVHAMQEGE